MPTAYPVLSKTPDCRIIAGSFAPAGAGAVTAVNGSGFTVARTAQGTFTVTLDEAARDLVAATATAQTSAADNYWAQVGDTDVSTAKTLVIRLIDETGTAQDLAANANNRVNFIIIVSRKDVTQ